MSVFELWALFVALPTLEGISTFILVLLCITFVAIGIIFLISEGESWDGTKMFLEKFKSILIGLLLLGVVGNFVPNEKQIALIIGGAVATNTEGVEKLPENLVKAANSFLERMQEEAE